jgi:hypothetical protein
MAVSKSTDGENSVYAPCKEDPVGTPGSISGRCAVHNQSYWDGDDNVCRERQRLFNKLPEAEAKNIRW